MLILDSLDDVRLVELLHDGGVGVMPSDTVYGLVCRAADKEAVARLYQIKARDGKPGTVIAASVEDLVELGIPRRYLKPVEHFWPNPLSIVVPDEASLAYLDKNMMSLAVRIPADTRLGKILEGTGPLLTTSANHPGEPVANTLQEAQAYFEDRLDFYVDGGDLSGRPPSTVVRIVDDEIVVLRQGSLRFDDQGALQA